MAKDKDILNDPTSLPASDFATQPAAEDQAVIPPGQGHTIVQVVMPQAKPAEPIKDFDKTVPGGRYKVGSVYKDAHGNVIPEGQDRQDPQVLAVAQGQAADLSRLPIPDTGSGPAK